VPNVPPTGCTGAPPELLPLIDESPKGTKVTIRATPLNASVNGTVESDQRVTGSRECGDLESHEAHLLAVQGMTLVRLNE
jgi:hypothetical protein